MICIVVLVLGLISLVNDATLIVIAVFFFQAEDGIRDWSVTGVQTCALPIYARSAIRPVRPARGAAGRGSGGAAQSLAAPRRLRSEERRVGKECRSGWSPYA